MKKNRKTILITGGAGLIGSFLAERLLSEGHTIVILDNFHTFCRHPPVRSMGILQCIHSLRTTGVVSIRSGKEVAMMKENVSLKRYSLISCVSTVWISESHEYLTPMDHVCVLMMAV